MREFFDPGHKLGVGGGAGTGEDAQEFDSYTGGASEKKFILHYNFPNFSKYAPRITTVR